MENSTTTIEKLIEKSEIYARTSLELYTCETVLKSVNIVSNLAVKLAITGVVVLFLLLINVGLALLIGQKIGEVYYGFFTVAAFYLLLAIILFIFKEKLIKMPVSTYIINQMKNEAIL
jgi:hypothetical protein